MTDNGKTENIVEKSIKATWPEIVRYTVGMALCPRCEDEKKRRFFAKENK